MNVLVYSGPEVLQSSLTRSLSSLRAVLYPHYTVQPITLQSLATHPWSSSCALLVFPACREYLTLTSAASLAIRSYIENGGAFLGLRAGGRVGGGNLHGGFDASDYTLRLQDKDSGISFYIYFAAGGEERCRRISIRPENGADVTGILETAPIDFSELVKARNIRSILARHVENESILSASFRIGRGTVALWGPHIEAPTPPEEGLDAEERRRDVIRDTLRAIGLRLPTLKEQGPTHPLPQLLTCSPTRPDIVHRILEALSIQPPATLKDLHDTFAFHDQIEGEKLVETSRSLSSPPDDEVRHIVAYAGGSLPPPEITPLFDVRQYFSTLADARAKTGCKTQPETWGAGEAFLYGEVVTSTQTLLDKNPHLLSLLPSPVLSLATHQLAGRGRGRNSWVSPAGCLQFSLRLRASLADVPGARLVFLQYLFALAVVEACRDDAVLGQWGDRVRVKWPNDIYIVGEYGHETTTKVAGILVFTAFEGNAVDIIIGCGINVLSPPPIASLTSLIPSGDERTLSMERTTAIIMAKFEAMWEKFIASKGSFEPFMDLYLDRWLHSDQLVTLTTTSPHRRVRIIGITSDHGLLRTVPEGGGGYGAAQEYIDLQPDGNTFDLMSGLIMAKV